MLLLSSSPLYRSSYSNLLARSSLLFVELKFVSYELGKFSSWLLLKLWFSILSNLSVDKHFKFFIVSRCDLFLISSSIFFVSSIVLSVLDWGLFSVVSYSFLRSLVIWDWFFPKVIRLFWSSLLTFFLPCFIMVEELLFFFLRSPWVTPILSLNEILKIIWNLIKIKINQLIFLDDFINYKIFPKFKSWRF